MDKDLGEVGAVSTFATFASESRECMDKDWGEVGAVSISWTSTVGNDLLLLSSLSILNIACNNFLATLEALHSTLLRRSAGRVSN